MFATASPFAFVMALFFWILLCTPALAVPAPEPWSHRPGAPTLPTQSDGQQSLPTGISTHSLGSGGFKRDEIAALLTAPGPVIPTKMPELVADKPPMAKSKDHSKHVHYLKCGNDLSPELRGQTERFIKQLKADGWEDNDQKDAHSPVPRSIPEPADNTHPDKWSPFLLHHVQLDDGQGGLGIFYPFRTTEGGEADLAHILKDATEEGNGHHVHYDPRVIGRPHRFDGPLHASFDHTHKDADQPQEQHEES